MAVCVSELETMWKVYSGVALPLGTHIPNSLCIHVFHEFRLTVLLGILINNTSKSSYLPFPGGLDGKESVCNAEDQKIP